MSPERVKLLDPPDKSSTGNRSRIDQGPKLPKTEVDVHRCILQLWGAVKLRDKIAGVTSVLWFSS